MTLINIFLMLNIIRKLIFIVKILNPLAFKKKKFFIINRNNKLWYTYTFLLPFNIFKFLFKVKFSRGMLEHSQQRKLPILMNFTIYLILFLQYLINKIFYEKSVYQFRIKATKELLSLPWFVFWFNYLVFCK